MESIWLIYRIYHTDRIWILYRDDRLCMIYDEKTHTPRLQLSCLVNWSDYKCIYYHIRYTITYQLILSIWCISWHYLCTKWIGSTTTMEDWDKFLWYHLKPCREIKCRMESMWLQARLLYSRRYKSILSLKTTILTIPKHTMIWPQ